MEKNPKTWAAVSEHFGGMDPKADQVLERLAADDCEARFVLVCWEGIEDHGDMYVAGAWATLEELASDYGWGSGVPEYAIDLTLPPEEALVDLALVIKPIELRDTIANRGIEVPS